MAAAARNRKVRQGYTLPEGVPTEGTPKGYNSAYMILSGGDVRFRCVKPYQKNELLANDTGVIKTAAIHGDDKLMQQVMAYPCGQCLPCRLASAKRRARRIAFECLAHRDNMFVTLSYSDRDVNGVPAEVYNRKGRLAWKRYKDTGRTILPPEGLKVTEKGYSGNRMHWKQFKDRVRYKLKKLGLVPRFYVTFEYGTKNERPHFHVIYYGLPMAFEDLIRSCWMDGNGQPRGNVDVKTGDIGLGYYLSSYMEKTRRKLKDRLAKKWLTDSKGNVREPEFGHGSTNPLIGWTLVQQNAEKARSKYPPEKFKQVMIDWYVNQTIKGRPKPPSDKYFMGKFADLVGLDEEAVRRVKKDYARQVMLIGVKEAEKQKVTVQEAWMSMTRLEREIQRKKHDHYENIKMQRAFKNKEL